MPPTVQGGDKRQHPPPKEPERKSDLICRIKYCNTLPDIPFDLKFIKYPFDPNRFIHYNPTSLEKNYKWEVLTEHDLGVGIDLINRDAYQSEGGAGGQLEAADERLLEEDALAPQDSKRSRQHGKSVSWLRRSEYISTEQTRFQPQTMEKVEAKVGYNVKKSLGEETLYIMDRDSQIKAIDKTFDDNRAPVERHYSKPGVTPVEILDVFPDFSLWKHPCAQVIFDSDPAPQDRPVAAQIEQMSQAMIRGVMDESGEQFVAYFLPTDETIALKRSEREADAPVDDDAQYEYKMAREYNWNVKSKASKGYEENYFLVIRDGRAYYNELETRVRLSKRRTRAGAGVGGPGGTRLVVTHRPLTEHDHRMQRLRERQLEPPQEDDEELEQDDQEEEKEDNDERRSRSKSRSPEGSREGSPRGSGRSRSGSPRKSGSEANSRASSRSRSGSRSRSKSRSKSRSRSGSGSPRRSRNGSRASSKSGSRSRSNSGSEAGSKASSNRSRSGSRARSASGSRQGSRSGSASSRSSARSGSESE